MRYPVGNNKKDFDDNWYNAQGFGVKTSYGYHEGVDLNLKTGGDSDLGQPLYAVADGVIRYYHTLSHPTSGFGMHFVLECDTPWGKRWFHYAHNQSQISVVQSVREGEQIGTLGKSGTSFAHLHFACFKVDPATLYRGIDSVARTQDELKNWEDPLAFLNNWYNYKPEPIAPPMDDIRLTILEANNIKTEGQLREVLGAWNDYTPLKTDLANARKEIERLTIIENKYEELKKIHESVKNDFDKDLAEVEEKNRIYREFLVRLAKKVGSTQNIEDVEAKVSTLVKDSQELKEIQDNRPLVKHPFEGIGERLRTIFDLIIKWLKKKAR